VHDGTESTDQQVEDTEAWRQIHNAIAVAGGKDATGWLLLERPANEPTAPEEEWVCLAFTTEASDALAWHDLEAARVARPVLIAPRSA
jgi:hypothetical protein